MCTRSSIVYENICSKCNPDVAGKGELTTKEGAAPSLYVGETSRTIQEQALEHWGAARRGDKTSHMAKHQTLEHNGEPPLFHMRMVSYHRTALNRQVKEAVRIRRRGGASSILNSRSEYNRCYIPRLVVEEEEEGAKAERERLEKEERGKLIKSMGQEDITWEEKKRRARELGLKKRRRETDTGELGSYEETEPGERIKRKKLKYSTLDEDWGAEMEWVEEQTDRESTTKDGGTCDPALTTLSTPRERRGCKRKVVKTSLKPSSITDYFGVLKRRREDRMEKGDQSMEEFDDNEWFEEQTDSWVGLVTRDDFLEQARNQMGPSQGGMTDNAPSSQGGDDGAQQGIGAAQGWLDEGLRSHKPGRRLLGDSTRSGSRAPSSGARWMARESE